MAEQCTVSLRQLAWMSLQFPIREYLHEKTADTRAFPLQCEVSDGPGGSQDRYGITMPAASQLVHSCARS